MRKITGVCVIIVLMLFVVPAFFSAVAKFTAKKDEVVAEFTQPFNITVFNTEKKLVENIEFEEYITGFVAGEMPPTYDSEALKAQAVAARSYILTKAGDYFSGQNSPEHHGAMICTDSAHCKSWRPISDAKRNWDIRYADEYEKKIKNAVCSTSGEYMTYDGEPVKAYFYAISGGRTEDISDVWGASVPYLKSVNSREDVGSDGFESMYTIKKEDFLSKLKEYRNDFEMTDYVTGDEDISRTAGGGVNKIIIGNIELSGKEIKELFNLRSTNFKLEYGKDTITFRVYGYGHGVGMSQNGANVLAKNGMKYDEILKHYYTGVFSANLYK